MVKRQNGQAIIESILAITLFMVLTTFVASEFKSRKIISGLVSGPWKGLDGMIRNGSWTPRADSDTKHPNYHLRHVSIRGELAQ